jgi:nucleoside-diphosphate-sugar epimerase
MTKRIAITGVSGFVGTNVLHRLIGTPGIKVLGIDRQGNPGNRNYGFSRSDFQFVRADILKPLPMEIKKLKIDGIVHLASRQPSNLGISYDEFYRGNVESTRRVIELAKQKNVDFVVFTSTTTVCGGIKLGHPIDEKTPENPKNFYGLSKYISERLLEQELASTRTKVIIFRCPSLMGPESPGGLIETYADLARRNAPIEIFSRGLRRRNILHVWDLAQAINKIIHGYSRLGTFEVFVLGSKNSLAMLTIAKTICRILGSKASLRAVNTRPPVDQDIIINSEKAQRVLGFAPMTIQQGLKQCLNK